MPTTGHPAGRSEAEPALAVPALHNATNHRFVARETLVSAAINVAIGLAACSIAQHGKAVIPLSGGSGVLAGMVPASFMTAFMAVLVPTLLARSQSRKGRLTAFDTRLSLLPQHAVLRAVLAAMLVTLLAIPLLALLLPILTPACWSLPWLLAFNAVYAAVLTGLVTPPAIRDALRPKK
jgi:hypothetical protein